jgi:hypothetical protein
MSDLPPFKTDPACPLDQIWLIPSDIAERLDLWPLLSNEERRKLLKDFEEAAKEKRVGVIKNVQV